MLRAPFVLAVLLLGGIPATAEEPAPDAGPKAPPTAEAAADEVLKALLTPGLAALARRDTPDPWLVADALCARGAFDAAAAFAKAAPRPDVAALPAYVNAARVRTDAAAERARLEAVTQSLRARDGAAVVEKTNALPAADTVVRIRLLHARALALGGLGRANESEAALAQAADAARALGWLRQGARLFGMAGMAAARGFAWDRALAAWQAQLALEEQRGNRLGAAKTRNNLGLVHGKTGAHAQALAQFESALESAKALQERGLAASVLGNMGIVYETQGDLTKALATYEQALREKMAIEDRAGAAVTLGNIGAIHDSLGNLRKALSIQERVLEMRKALGDPVAIAQTIGDMGSAQHALGQYAKALSSYEDAIERQLALGDKAGAAISIGNLAGTYLELGEHEKALATNSRAYDLLETLGDRATAAVTLGNKGLILTSMGKLDDALEAYRRAHGALKAMGQEHAAANLLINIGAMQHRRGDHEKARVTLEEALAQYESSRSRSIATTTRLSLGRVQRALGNRKEAVSLLKRAERDARTLRATPLQVQALRALTELQLDAGNAVGALGYAERALDALEGLLGGLGEEQGASAREAHASLFALGALAAVQEEDTASAVKFLESGRAGALLDALGRRETLRWRAESLAPELREADRAARDAQRAARRAYDRASQRGRLKAMKAAGARLDKATEGVREVAARIQRELKQQAGLYYPRAETIETIRRALRADQALVLYGLCREEALALVLRRRDARTVSLGAVERIADACDALDAADPEKAAKAALDALRALLVKPLDLGKDVEQVLVSPEGPLCYLPFGALFDRTVAMTPSGTTHVLLREQRHEGSKGVLAIGDPDYRGVSQGAQAVYFRGRTLSPLPASGAEIDAIGTTVLRKEDASEAGLRKALATSKSWRAVHFACHGLVNVRQPMLSSLALSRSGEDDGFVTALEILRMQIPADLAVLSACETARGRIVKGEGIVGLTRAFMFAGAPRVICSLWKVDDEATRALMVKFYELWKQGGVKGLGAADALRAAQAHVRAQDKWKHPYYWAAWVLWGLPD